MKTKPKLLHFTDGRWGVAYRVQYRRRTRRTRRVVIVHPSLYSALRACGRVGSRYPARGIK